VQLALVCIYALDHDSLSVRKWIGSSSVNQSFWICLFAALDPKLKAFVVLGNEVTEGNGIGRHGSLIALTLGLSAWL
jgi:hypothetical protein